MLGLQAGGTTQPVIWFLEYQVLLAELNRNVVQSLLNSGTIAGSDDELIWYLYVLVSTIALMKHNDQKQHGEG